MKIPLPENYSYKDIITIQTDIKDTMRCILIDWIFSLQNKNQCDSLNICWVACRDPEGYKRFGLALKKFNIPYVDYNGNLDEDLPAIIDSVIA